MKRVSKLFLVSSLSFHLVGGPLYATEPKVTVYKSPSCACCKKWVSHLEANGIEVESVDIKDLRLIKSMSGIEPKHASCHTAKVDGYVVEVMFRQTISSGC